MTLIELRGQVLMDLLRKSSVNGHSEVESIDKLLVAALYMAQVIYDGQIPTDPGEDDVALPDTFKTSSLLANAKTFKNSGGSAAITLASLANGNGTTTGGRQSVTLDLGALWAQRWKIEANLEFAATPTAGTGMVNLYGAFGDATGAGHGNTTGTDAAYSGYSSNLDAAAKHLEWLGSHVCTSQATPTVQKSLVGIFFPKGRYLNLVVDNRSGAAFHTTDTNQGITITPLEESVEE